MYTEPLPLSIQHNAHILTELNQTHISHIHAYSFNFYAYSVLQLTSELQRVAEKMSQLKVVVSVYVWAGERVKKR